ncbi:MAG TPA: hypothetical protein VF187_11210, partial [Gemmatimonadales bacterium]
MREIDLQLFAEEGFEDPTAGEEAGEIGDGGLGGEPEQPGRTFTQQDVDRIVRERLARAERRWQQQLESVVRQHGQPAQPAAQPPANPIEARLAALEESVEDQALAREIEVLSRKYPDFAKNEDEILETALRLGTPDLEVAYRYWAHDRMAGIDVESIKQEAIKEYLAQKERQARSTPAPEGAGGGMPSGA